MSKAIDFYPLQKVIGKSLNSEYGEELLDNNRCTQNSEKASGDLIGNKIEGELQKLLHRVPIRLRVNP